MLVLFLIFKNNAQHYKFTHYNAEKGLPNVLTKAILKDKLGFVWIGTDAGVFRFDGKKYVSFIGSLSSPYIKSFSFIKDDRLVVVHDNGIDFIDNQIDTVIFSPLIKGSNQITDSAANYPKNIFEDDEGKIWINEPQSIVYLEKDGTVKRFDFGKKHRTNSFLRSFSFAKFNSHSFVIASQQGGLFVYNYKSGSYDSISSKKPLGNINTVAQIKEGVVWVGASEGLFQINLSNESFAIKKISDIKGISKISVGKTDEILFGTWNSGLYWTSYLSDNVDIYPVNLGTNIVVNDIFIEDNGDAWVSTDDGFYFLRKTFFAKIELPYRRNYIQSVSRLGNQYFASDGAVAYQIEILPNQLRSKPSFKEIYIEKNGDLLAIAPTPTHIWMGNSSGKILKYENQTIKELDLLHLGGTVYYITADDFGNAWVCQYDLDGLLKVTPDLKCQQYNKEKGILSSIYVTKKLSDGNIYSGGDGNVLYRYDAEKDSFISIKIDFKNNSTDKMTINDFVMDDKGIIWVGSNFGLLKLEKTSDSGIQNASKMYFGEDLSVKSLAISKNNTLWIGTDNGVFGFVSGSGILYDEFSGLPSKTCSYKAIMVDEASRVWVATSNGIAVSSESVQENLVTPQPIILQLQVNQQNVRIPSKKIISLPYLSSVNLNFASILYPSEKVKYQYRILGIQEEWSELSDKNEVMLTRLAAGKYVLEAKALQKSGYTISDTLKFEINIITPWYQTYWAYSLLGLTIIGVCFLAVKLYNQRLVAEKERLEKLVEARTSEIKKQQESLQLMNENLRASEEELRQNTEELLATNEQLQSARQEQQKFVTLVNNSEDIIVLADFQDKIIYMNLAAKRALGLSADEMLENKKLQDFNILGDEKSAEKIKKQIILKGKAQYENTLYNRKTNQFLEVDALTIQVVDTEKRKAICLATIQRDITQRKIAEREINSKNAELKQALEELKTTQKQLIQSEKMADLGKIAAGVAHEVNTPLGAIQSSINNIYKSIDKTINAFQTFFPQLDPDLQKHLIKVVEENKNNTSFLTLKELRQAKRVLRGELENMNIVDADFFADSLAESGILNISPSLSFILNSDKAKECIDFIHRIIGFYKSTDTIDMAVKKASKIVVALKNFSRVESAEEKQLTSISQNIENVLTLYQNQLKVGVEVVKNFEEDIKLLAFPDELQQVWVNLIHNSLHAMKYKGVLTIKTKKIDNQVEISIEDTGSGIPAEIQPKIFDVFFTTKPAGEGTGLGLDIVRRIVEKHKGTISFRSEEGKGTIFFVKLPLEESK
ncbi:MAG: hypothetical protein OHK0038_06380 [Flammeovirgaceae bacterium]